MRSHWSAKVGKTSTILQLTQFWSGSEITWFDCPLSESDDCAEEIGGELIGLLLPRASPVELLRSPTKLDAALAGALAPRSRHVVVVDNADRLSRMGLHRLGEMLKLIRRRGYLANLGCVFIASRRLGALQSAVDEVVTAPAWTAAELGLLLDRHGLA
jgi:hypothetical protein